MSRTIRRARRGVPALAFALLAAPLLSSCSATQPAAQPDTVAAAAVDESDEEADEPVVVAPVVELGEEVETVAVFLARDPFRPVVTTPAADGGDTTDPAPAPSGDPTDPNAPAPDPTDPPAPAPGEEQPGDGCHTVAAGEVCDGQLVELLDVSTVDGVEQADVRVDDGVFQVREGDRFAANYLVQGIDPPCVSFLHGDESFTLCEGQQVLK